MTDTPTTLVINIPSLEPGASTSKPETPDAVVSDAKFTLEMALDSVKEINSAQQRTDAYIAISDRYIALFERMTKK